MSACDWLILGHWSENSFKFVIFAIFWIFLDKSTSIFFGVSVTFYLREYQAFVARHELIERETCKEWSNQNRISSGELNFVMNIELTIMLCRLGRGGGLSWLKRTDKALALSPFTQTTNIYFACNDGNNNMLIELCKWCFKCFFFPFLIYVFFIFFFFIFFF